MKALILAGGRGKRIGQKTETCNKSMLPIHGRPLIEYSLRSAQNANVKEIIIVVGYRAEEIINTFGNSYGKIRIRYVIQWEQKGLVHAIECAKEAIDRSNFMLFLADEILKNPRHTEMLQIFHNDSVFALCGIVHVEDISYISKTYAIIQNDENNRIYRLIEKPNTPLNDIMGTGNCIFKNEILDYIAKTPINQQRGEKELPDLIQCAIDDGKIVKSFAIGGKYININTAEDLRMLEEEVQNGK